MRSSKPQSVPTHRDTPQSAVPKYVLATLGCKVNQYESQQIRETLESLGLRPAQACEIPDVAVVNTCAVTASALAKSRRAVRRITRDERTSVIVVGCAPAADPEGIRKIDGVAATLDHSVDVCSQLATLVCRCRSSSQDPPSSPNYIVSRSLPVVKREELGSGDCGLRIGRVTAPQSTILDPKPAIAPLTDRIGLFAEHQRAFLKVQDGCDARCTYCIVPQLRPNLRSKPIETAVAEARELVRAGHKEIVVTGIFLGAYGCESAIRKPSATGRSSRASGRSALVNLVDALAGVEGLERLRLSSLEPGDVDEWLLDVLASHRNCVPHLHLPLQSGSARILRRMNRQYTLDAFVATVDRVRGILDRPALTTDIIVGFPGETDDDFRATLELAADSRFAKIHAFPFSPRAGTPAARWRELFVPPSEVRARMNRLRDVERGCSFAYRQSLVGQIERVLVETVDRRLSNVDFTAERKPELGNRQPTIARGRSDRYIEVHFKTFPDVRPGDLVPVRIDRVTPTRCRAVQLSV